MALALVLGFLHATGVAFGATESDPAQEIKPVIESESAIQADASVSDTARDLLNMRDPFQRPAPKENSKGIPRTELENFAVDQFTLLGMTTGPDRVKAMLKAPDGKTHFVTENMRIGMRNGVIRKITPISILVREKLVNVMGQEETVDAEIKLPPENTKGTE